MRPRPAQVLRKESVKVDQDVIFQAREIVTSMHIGEDVEKYIVAIIMATRKPERYADSPLKDWIAVGAGPRSAFLVVLYGALVLVLSRDGIDRLRGRRDGTVVGTVRLYSS